MVVKIAAVTMLWFTSFSMKAQKAIPPKANIIILYADDLGYGDISCNGATKIHTPNIDRIANEGLRFTNPHSTASTCTPSRYSLLTGEYAWRKKGTNILPANKFWLYFGSRVFAGSVRLAVLL